jgi:hypothetical protein
MDCLNNLVQIWDKCTERDPDLLYIDQLPGFDLDWPNFFNKEQVDSGIELLTRIRNKAGIMLSHEFLNNLNPRVKVGSVLSNEVVGQIQDNLQEKAIEAGKYKGIQLALNHYPYLQIYVDKISLFAKTVITTNIKVIDLTQGITLDDLPITTVAGQITTIQVGKTYKNKGQYLNLAFVIDSSLAITYETTVNARACGSCFPKLERLGSYAFARGVKISQAGPLVEQNIQGEGHTNGLTVYFSTQCDHQHFICGMANRFQLPMYYKFGIELMEEGLTTDNLNSLTTVGKDKMKKIQEYCEKGYTESMSGILQNLELPNNACYYCQPMITNRVNIP